jgi:hypothetical protein
LYETNGIKTKQGMAPGSSHAKEPNNGTTYSLAFGTPKALQLQGYAGKHEINY